MKIGIDLGGSHIAIGIITEQGKIIAKQEENINFIQYKNENLKLLIRDRILSLIHYVLEEIQVPMFTMEEIGIGFPGIVQENKIQACTKYNIFDWDLATELEKQCKIPTKIQNDAICSAKAEKAYGTLKETKKAVFLCLGTGIGGATILGETILPSEYGHMTIQENGRECHCGKKGCFETYSSMKAFKEGLIEKMKLNKNMTSEELLVMLKNKLPNVALDTYIDQYIHTLLLGISKIIHEVNPEIICLGGSFTYFADILYKRLLEQSSKMPADIKNTKFVLAKLQNTAGIIGATL